MSEVAMLIETFSLLPEGANCFTTQRRRLMAEHATITLQHILNLYNMPYELYVSNHDEWFKGNLMTLY
jgi:hypothetical protein